MSGLLRNILALIVGLFSYGRCKPEEITIITVWATPWDTGWRLVKSDKYLQFAETAQIDYLLKTGIFFSLLSRKIGFVNLAQTVRFFKPVSMFSAVQVSTQQIYSDEKCAFFSHRIYAGADLAAEVLVKMKFKQGRLTIAPSTILPAAFTREPAQVKAWNACLNEPSAA